MELLSFIFIYYYISISSFQVKGYSGLLKLVTPITPITLRTHRPSNVHIQRPNVMMNVV